MELKPYRNEDLAMMPPRACEIESAKLEQELAYIGIMRMQNPGFTLWDGDKPIGAAGIIIFQEGVGEAWLRGSVRMALHPVVCGLEVKRGLTKLVAEYNLRRVQALIAINNRVAIHFAQWLGFMTEGRLHKLGPNGEDYFMMALFEA